MIEELSQFLRKEFPVHLLRDPRRVELVARRWLEKHRVWHGPAHLLAMGREIVAAASGEEREILLLSALYHDSIYDPRASDNEEASARLLLEDAADGSSSLVIRAADIIRASKWDALPADPLTLRFFELDTAQLSEECPMTERWSYERAVFRE